MARRRHVDGEAITVGLGHSNEVPQGFRRQPCSESSEELVIITRQTHTGA